MAGFYCGKRLVKLMERSGDAAAFFLHCKPNHVLLQPALACSVGKQGAVMKSRRKSGGFGEQPCGYAGTASIEKPWRRIEATSRERSLAFRSALVRVLPRLASATKER